MSEILTAVVALGETERQLHDDHVSIMHNSVGGLYGRCGLCGARWTVEELVTPTEEAHNDSCLLINVRAARVELEELLETS